MTAGRRALLDAAALVLSVTVGLVVVVDATHPDPLSGLVALVAYYVGVPQVVQAGVAQILFRRPRALLARGLVISALLAAGTLLTGLVLPLTSPQERLATVAFLLVTAFPISLATSGLTRLVAHALVPARQREAVATGGRDDRT